MERQREMEREWDIRGGLTDEWVESFTERDNGTARQPDSQTERS